ncbi:hydroxyphenylacetyl-CoA thioesterase PaaI [Nocardioides sp. CBS4Y-1]|uniref:Hydroxyphenylacetyl-CoA thioesterase PaaI n=2 Tax=Nocardioides acrostichi TaxID=2784339 RepID=A0A930UWW1_9ACTN|nr:hydroxyphenylacetyl-CoA thioesterase PaaI [Nocardioides acrostichi]
MPRPADPTLLARACAEALWAGDAASQALGMSLESVGPGTSRVRMTVRDDMVNGYGHCHGGILSALADTAFAFACNSRDVVTVAAGFDITFLSPGLLGALLVAEAQEVALRGRSGLYDVTVRDGDTVVAEFRGRSRALGRPILEES